MYPARDAYSASSFARTHSEPEITRAAMPPRLATVKLPELIVPPPRSGTTADPRAKAPATPTMMFARVLSQRDMAAHHHRHIGRWPSGRDGGQRRREQFVGVGPQCAGLDDEEG